jgi:hypothetical protein
MGSNESAPSSARVATATSSVEDSSKMTGDPSKIKVTESSAAQKSSKLSGFALIQHECRKKKREYDKCYAHLYGSFMNAKATEENDCSGLFDEWRECILRRMMKDRQERGVEPPAKDSMLADLEHDDEKTTRQDEDQKKRTNKRRTEGLNKSRQHFH